MCHVSTQGVNERIINVNYYYDKVRRIRFGGVLVTANYGHYDQHAARIELDGICRVRLPASDSVPFFQRMPGSACVKPARIRSGWPGQVLTKRIWSGRKSVCKNHRTRFWKNATGPLPVSHFKTLLCSSADGPDHIVQSQPGSDLILVDCVRFWPNGSGPEASRCARIIQHSSGNASEPNRIGPSMFPEILFEAEKKSSIKHSERKP